MEKLLMFLMIAASVLTLWVKDVEIFLQDKAYRHVSYAIEHAVHDGALQIDAERLGEGDIVFNKSFAEFSIRESLKRNLGLNDQLLPVNTLLFEENISINEIVYFDETYIDPLTLQPVQFPYLWKYQNPYTNEVLERVIFGPSVALILDVKVRGANSYTRKVSIQEYKF